MRNFGHNGPEEYFGIGINGKNSEFHAAMGLVNLNYLDRILEKRKSDSFQYDQWLVGKGIQRPSIPDFCTYNYSYYPVIFESSELAMKVFKALQIHEIFARRYFYPSLSNLPYVDKQETPICDDISSRVICLPLYFQLSEAEIDMICRLVIRTLKY
jgi:dTDP-4-amino-4,6-dideoxygalactose transaminase